MEDMFYFDEYMVFPWFHDTHISSQDDDDDDNDDDDGGKGGEQISEELRYSKMPK